MMDRSQSLRMLMSMLDEDHVNTKLVPYLEIMIGIADDEAALG